MKRIVYLVVALFLFVSVASNAELRTDYKSDVNIENLKVPLSKPQGLIENYQDSKDNKTQNVTWRQIYLDYLGSAFTQGAHQTPMCYDPVSKILYVATIDPITVNEQWSSLGIVVFHSNNYGVSWQKRVLLGEEAMGGFNPSIAVANYQNSMSFNDIPFTVFSRFVERGVTGWTAQGKGAVYGAFNNGDFFADLTQGPTTNNPNVGQEWAAMPLRTWWDNQTVMSFASGVTSPKTGFRYGVYGLFVYNPLTETITQSKMPTEWDHSLFRPSTELDRSFNAQMNNGVDQNGNFYVAVNNMFAVDENNRVPAVSKSTDFGATWSQFNRMPNTVISNYASVNGYATVHNFAPYQSYNFTVINEDEYSFFYLLGMTNSQDWEALHLVEVYYKNGSWGIRKVADDLPYELPAAFYRSGEGFPETSYRIVNPSSRAMEIQVARTADNQNLIVKYIAYTNEVTFPNPVNITYMNQETGVETATTLPGWYTSDIFLTYRPIDGTSWRAPNNVTNSQTHHRATWIPDVVESLSDIPVIYHSTAVYSETNHPFNLLPLTLRDHIMDFPSFHMMGKAGITLSAEENNMNFNFDLLDAFPSPAVDYTEIPFVLNAQGFVTLEVFNALGQKVTILLDGWQSEGPHSVNFDLSSLNSGVYYYTLTFGGQRLTKSLSVIR